MVEYVVPPAAFLIVTVISAASVPSIFAIISELIFKILPDDAAFSKSSEALVAISASNTVFPNIVEALIIFGLAHSLESLLLVFIYYEFKNAKIVNALLPPPPPPPEAAAKLASPLPSTVNT